MTDRKPTHGPWQGLDFDPTRDLTRTAELCPEGWLEVWWDTNDPIEPRLCIDRAFGLDPMHLAGASLEDALEDVVAEIGPVDFGLEEWPHGRIFVARLSWEFEASDYKAGGWVPDVELLCGPAGELAFADPWGNPALTCSKCQRSPALACGEGCGTILCEDCGAEHQPPDCPPAFASYTEAMTAMSPPDVETEVGSPPAQAWTLTPEENTAAIAHALFDVLAAIEAEPTSNHEGSDPPDVLAFAERVRALARRRHDLLKPDDDGPRDCSACRGSAVSGPELYECPHCHGTGIEPAPCEDWRPEKPAWTQDPKDRLNPLDDAPAIRCWPETGVVLHGADGPFLTIVPCDGGDVFAVHIGDVVAWHEAGERARAAFERSKAYLAPEVLDATGALDVEFAAEPPEAE